MTKFWHIAAKNEIEDSLNTDFERGMTNEFAQGKLKQSKTGYAKNNKDSFKFFAMHLSSVMAILLVILSVVFMFTERAVEGTTLVILVLISELLGYGQDIAALIKEKKAKMLLNPKAVVIRDGESFVVSADQVAQGDIVVLKKGDIVPCDGRIVFASDLEVNEKAVTGNEIVVKDADAELTEETPVEQQANMLFAGSSILSGECRIVAVRTNDETVIATTKENEKTEKSFMQNKISEVGKVLAVLGFVFILIVFALSVVFGENLWQAGALCLALGTVLVPAKISSVISYIVNHGMLKIANSGSVVKNETICENLALCDVVITGKSGILTKEESKVSGVFTYDGWWQTNDADLSSAQKSIQMIMLEFAAICTGSSKEKNMAEEYAVDNAILNAAKEMEIAPSGIEVAASYPFDPERKIMTAVAKTGEGFRIITKGSVKEILDRSKHAVSSMDLYDMTDEIKQDLLEKCENAAQSGLKTIAVAYKDESELLSREDAECNLIFVGTFLLENEIRTESAESVEQLESAGIKTVVATYDTLSVAEFVASQAGIKTEETNSLSGKEIEELTDEELDAKIESVSVFAELTPEIKEKIVNSYKRLGKTVCVFADSASDAKTFELCDISVAKKEGSDVTWQNADLVTDGSFTDFADTVKKCQTLYLDVRKALRYMISGGIGLVLFVIFALALTSKLPLNASQTLATGILTSGVLPLALPTGGAWDKLNLKNVKKSCSVFLNMWARILGSGIFSAAIALVLFINVRFFSGLQTDALAISGAQTAAVTFFVFGALFSLLATRINTLMMKEGREEAITIGVVALISIIAFVIAVFIPGVKILFGFNGRFAAIAILVALLPGVLNLITEAFKFIKKGAKTEDANGTDI